MRISIDPGANGAIAWEIKGTVNAIKMPEILFDMFESLKTIKAESNRNPICIQCVIEKVGGYMPGNSGPAAVKFARHCGHIEMALYALGISTTQVLPATWEHWLIGKPNYPKIPKTESPAMRARILSARKTERKNKIKSNVQARYPHLKITLATADALGILTYMMRGEK